MVYVVKLLHNIGSVIGYYDFRSRVDDQGINPKLKFIYRFCLYSILFQFLLFLDFIPEPLIDLVAIAKRKIRVLSPDTCTWRRPRKQEAARSITTPTSNSKITNSVKIYKFINFKSIPIRLFIHWRPSLIPRSFTK
jgi:hypothetical protein